MSNAPLRLRQPPNRPLTTIAWSARSAHLFSATTIGAKKIGVKLRHQIIHRVVPRPNAVKRLRAALKKRPVNHDRKRLVLRLGKKRPVNHGRKRRAKLVVKSDKRRVNNRATIAQLLRRARKRHARKRPGKKRVPLRHPTMTAAVARNAQPADHLQNSEFSRGALAKGWRSLRNNRIRHVKVTDSVSFCAF